MSFPKLLLFLVFILFGSITVVSFFKNKGDKEASSALELAHESFEIDLSLPEEEPVEVQDDVEFIEDPAEQASEEVSEDILQIQEKDLPEADRIAELFNKGEPRLPIVETITYKSRVPWQKGRAAWLADYASHYKTSRHFIARSLNGKPEYEKQNVSNGDRFNVYRTDKNFEFYLVIDLLTSKMWMYYVDNDTKEPTLLKTYPVGIGRPNPASLSGSLTPLGKYRLGDKIAVYKPNTKGYHQGEKVEMVRVFGSRWIPFSEEMEGCTEPAKGYGLHGLPLTPNPRGEYIEDRESLGRYESDGCIRMATEDVEELFAIIITRPTTVELVKGFHNNTLL